MPEVPSQKSEEFGRFGVLFVAQCGKYFTDIGQEVTFAPPLPFFYIGVQSFTSYFRRAAE
jgi:hypothetical protein